ncbi:MAG: hypothetical protein M1835_001131 [Candelina submexicana]|nr:MAG: hypothetical protein M1835_001131 [Candelina submexicana]
MAAVAGPQISGSWEHSVPINREPNELFLNPTHHVDGSSPTPVDRAQLQPLAHQTNGASLTHSSSRPELAQPQHQHHQATEPHHLSNSNGATGKGLLPPPRLQAFGRKDSSISESKSEADSLLDLYSSKSANRSGVNSMDLGDHSLSKGEVFADYEDPESSRWIHRDKLAQIESQELQQAGIYIRRKSRSGSRSTGRRDRSQDAYGNSTGSREHSGQYFQAQDEKRRRTRSPVPAESETDGEPMNFDLRHPEEAALDLAQDSGDRRIPSMLPRRKGSVSRLPLPTSSPIPIPQDYIERHTPVPRSAADKDGIIYSKARIRSQSAGSQMLLDDGGPRDSSTPSPSDTNTPQGSPLKAKVPNKAAPVSGARKVSHNRVASGQHQKPRALSSTQRVTSAQRPTTRSGEPRPVTSHNRPEGDPPWLATMYKPDPRLPPEQQMLPTHAKRLQREQWIREGKSEADFDLEFGPAEFQENGKLSPNISPVESPQKREEGGSWPLRSPQTLSTVSSEHGGYKTIPSVQNSQGNGPSLSPKPVQPIRVGDPPEEKQKKSGCACCIVM